MVSIGALGLLEMGIGTGSSQGDGPEVAESCNASQSGGAPLDVTTVICRLLSPTIQGELDERLCVDMTVLREAAPAVRRELNALVDIFEFSKQAC